MSFSNGILIINSTTNIIYTVFFIDSCQAMVSDRRLKDVSLTYLRELRANRQTGRLPTET
jgi:hypothetical protein